LSSDEGTSARRESAVKGESSGEGASGEDRDELAALVGGKTEGTKGEGELSKGVCLGKIEGRTGAQSSESDSPE